MKQLYNDIKILLKTNGILLLLLFVLLYSSLEVYHIYVRIFFAIVAFCVISIRRYFDRSALVITLFSITYALGLYLNDNINGGADYIGYIVCPLLFYLFGKKIVRRCFSNKELTTFLLMSIFLFGLKVYIATISDLLQGITISLSRTGDVDNVMSATLLSATISLGLVGLPAFFIFNRPVRNIKSWCFVITFFLSIISVTHQVSRTGIVIAIFCTIVVIAYKTSMQLSKLFFLLVVVTLVLWMLSSLDLIKGEVFDAYLARQDDLDKSMGNDGGRLYRWWHALGMLLLHPEGWKTTQYEYVHNFWLDVDMYAGIMPFIFLLIVTYSAIKRQMKLLKIRDNSFVAISFGINICMLMTSFVEPILQGNSAYVYFMFLIWGMQTQYMFSYKRLEINE